MKKLRKFIIPLLILIMATGIVFTYEGCSEKQETQAKTGKKEYWTCTMHPQVVSDKPGSCPICHMELIKKVDDAVDTKNDTAMGNMLTLSKGKIALAGVETEMVMNETIDQSIKTYSYLDFIEGSREVISARASGRIEKLFIRNTGDYISKGSPVFEIYSPTLVQAENEYLIALQNTPLNVSLTNNNEKNYGTKEFILSARKKLQLLGLTDQQIRDLEKSKEVNYTMTYYSPVSGFVIEKNIENGMYINEGMKLYEIGDISKLWDISEVFEKDLKNINKGSKIKLELRSYPGEYFDGVVTYIYPVVNSKTRTVQIRSEVVNKGNKLKPQMYGETTFNLGKASGLFVPEDAVLMTGKRNVVWVKTPDGMFEGREVEVGLKINNKVQVLKGLKEGEEIVSRGGYLVDSESQLRTGMSTGHNHANMQGNKEMDNNNQTHNH